LRPNAENLDEEAFPLAEAVDHRGVRGGTVRASCEWRDGALSVTTTDAKALVGGSIVERYYVDKAGQLMVEGKVALPPASYVKTYNRA